MSFLPKETSVTHETAVDLFFGLTGLTIDKSPGDDPLEFLFGDATLLSKEELEEVLETFNVSQFNSGHLDSDCYLAIKRLVDETNKEQFDQAQDSALSRAHYISAVLMLWLFARTNQRFYCGLTDLVGYPVETWMAQPLAIPADPTAPRGGLRGSWRITTKLQARPFFKYTRDQIWAELDRPDFQSLFKTIIRSDDHVNQKVRDTLQRACNRLAFGLYSQSHEEFAVSTVTALEILLADKESKEKIIRQRFCALVDKPLKDVERIYTVRNNCVHRGDKVSQEDAYLSIACGLSAVISMATLIFHFPAKTSLDELINYLDVATSTRTIDDDLLAKYIERLKDDRVWLRAQPDHQG